MVAAAVPADRGGDRRRRGHRRRGAGRHVALRADPAGRAHAAAGGEAGQRHGVRAARGARGRRDGVRHRDAAARADESPRALATQPASPARRCRPSELPVRTVLALVYAMLVDARRGGDRAVPVDGRRVAAGGGDGRARPCSSRRRCCSRWTRPTRSQPYLPTRYWLSFVDLFRDPILWRDVVRGTGAAAASTCVVFLGAGVGELHDEGHHRLSRVARAQTAADVGARRRPQRAELDERRSPAPTASLGMSPCAITLAGADRLHGEVEGALERCGVRRHDRLVVGRPDRDPRGPSGVSSVAFRARSRSLSGASCWHAVGHLSGVTSAASPARSVPWCGDPRVTTRRATAPPKSRAHSRAMTPPAE